MKKILYAMLLLSSQLTLNGMEENTKALTDGSRLSAVEECIKRIDWIDAAVKADISITDPEAFTKIHQYAGLLLTKLEKQSNIFASKKECTSAALHALQSLDEIKTKTKEMREKFQGRKNFNAQEISSTKAFLRHSHTMKQSFDAKDIQLWNVIKTTLLATIDIMIKSNEVSVP